MFTEYLPGSLLGTLYMIIHLVFTTAFKVGTIDISYSVDEETEAQVLNLCPKPHI